ncbi:MAG: hypothetical protein WCT20_03215 [Candidatus Babeliales bacterium]
MNKRQTLTIHRIFSLTGIGTIIFFVIVIALVALTPPPSYSDVFATMDEVETYAHNVNELTPMDGINTIKPSFSSYYATLELTTWRRITNKIKWLMYCVGLIKRPAWSITGFKNVLERLSIRNEKNGFKGNIIAKITGTEDDRYIVFGTLQGAFHSLTRDLQHLEKLGIINRSLKIIQPNLYIIFMGEAIDRSAFTLETLSLILKILEANPGKAIYLRGGHESKNYWQEHTLKTELLIRARDISRAKIPLEKEVNRFFNTLPLAFYIGMHPTPTKDFIRISKRGIGSDPLLDEKNSAPFFTTPHATITPYAVTKTEQLSTTAVTIRAILKSEKKRYAYQSMEGLRMLANDTGVTAWTLLSCPTVVYEKAQGMRFFFDAFTIVTPGQTLTDWIITLHHRDRRTKEPFLTKTFNLLSGLEQDSSTPQPKSVHGFETLSTLPPHHERSVENTSEIKSTAESFSKPKNISEDMEKTNKPFVVRSHAIAQRAAADVSNHTPPKQFQEQAPPKETRSDDVYIQQQPGSQVPLINLTVGDKPMTVTITVTTQQAPPLTRKE